MVYMAVAISIRVDEKVYEALKQLSEEHYRSINGEVNRILEENPEVKAILSKEEKAKKSAK